MQSLGKKLKTLRTSCQLSQEQLAEAIEVTVKSIQRYETGRFLPGTDILIKLATFFDVSTDYLLGLIGLKAQKAMEDKIFKKSQYHNLYLSYLKCKNDVKIDEHSDYYWIFLGDKSSHTMCSQWVGWADESNRYEIRKPRPLSPGPAIDLCTKVYERPMILNSENDAKIFRVFGGHAIAKADICEKYLPEFCEAFVQKTEDLKPYAS